MNGLLLIDKPERLTSHDVVFKARKLLGFKRIGHIGTLDPMATGLLVLVLGNATKLVSYFAGMDKTYQATIILGSETDTDDVTGTIVNENAIRPDDIMIHEVLKSFIGPSMQLPPAYAAIKINGKKLYEYAREGRKPPIVDMRPIEIKTIRDILIERDGSDVEIAFETTVSKGTYIRALARDIGHRLDTFATLRSLRRIRVGDFKIENAVSLEMLEAGKYELVDPLLYLGLPEMRADEDIARKIQNGVQLSKELFTSTTDTLICDESGNRLAIYRFDKEKDIMRMSVKLK